MTAVLAPKPLGGCCAVEWWIGPDGECQPREYADEVDERGIVMSRAKTLAQSRDCRHELHAHGHWLSKPYHYLYEIKTSGHRYLAFRHDDRMYVLLGVKKTDRKRQDRDYARAMKLREKALEHLRGGT